jgi:lipopolysaccharide export system protein LptA
VYASSPRTLTLTGDVVAMQGKSEYRGEKLVIDLTK